MQKKSLSIIVSIILAVAVLVTFTAIAQESNFRDNADLIPMIFVHGYSGSASQFETQAMRFASNGYPASYIRAFEYDSPRYFTDIPYRDEVRVGIDELIASLKEETGVEQVDLLGHSLGTSVCQGYLNSSSDRAANVAHYVNLDGGTATSLPGGVPTLAIWGRGSTSRQIVGATNVYFTDHTHTDVVTWYESFAEMYFFFTSREPATTDIVPEPPGQVRLAGRVHFNQTNIGVPGSTLEIWEINGNTGMRIGKKPEAVYQIGEDGSWGPFKAKGGTHYEYCLLRDDFNTQHVYTEPPIRSDYLVRIGTSTVSLMDSDNHSNLVISRNKEFWGDMPGHNDALSVNGTDIINAVTAPSLTSLVIAMLVYDKDSDGSSDVTQLITYPYPFVYGVDLYIPAADPPDDTIHITLLPRDGGGKVQFMNVPNWSSTDHYISIGFKDFVQDITTWVEYVQAN